MVNIKLECNKHPRYKGTKPSKCAACQWIYNYMRPNGLNKYGEVAFTKDNKHLPNGEDNYRSNFKIVTIKADGIHYMDLSK